jgi:hypothetical protein
VEVGVFSESGLLVMTGIKKRKKTVIARRRDLHTGFVQIRRSNLPEEAYDQEITSSVAMRTFSESGLLVMTGIKKGKKAVIARRRDLHTGLVQSRRSNPPIKSKATSVSSI